MDSNFSLFSSEGDVMDIVARLRMWAEWDYMTESASADLVIAANEIEKLREERNRLREALQKIASKNPFHNQCPPINNVQFYSQVIVEMVGIANAALKEKE